MVVAGSIAVPPPFALENELAYLVSGSVLFLLARTLNPSPLVLDRRDDQKMQQMVVSLTVCALDLFVRQVQLQVPSRPLDSGSLDHLRSSAMKIYKDPRTCSEEERDQSILVQWAGEPEDSRWGEIEALFVFDDTVT